MIAAALVHIAQGNKSLFEQEMAFNVKPEKGDRKGRDRDRGDRKGRDKDRKRSKKKT